MSLFDAFDSSAGENAARKGFQAERRGLNQARGDIRSNYGQAAKAQKTELNSANRALDQSYATGRNDLTGARDDSLGYLQSGADKAEGYYSQALEPWQNLSNSGQQGIDLYGQLVGLGDPSQMQERLASIPGYQFARDQGIDALNRNANSRGMLASGNQSQDVMRFSQGLADQNYFGYLNSLQPYFGLGQNAAGGLSQVYGQLGQNANQLGVNQSNINYGAGRDLSNLAQGYGLNRANVAQGAANNLSNIYQNQGSQMSGLSQAQGQAGADKHANIYNAQQAADNNMWQALIAGGNMLAGGVGAYTGAGGTFGGGGSGSVGPVPTDPNLPWLA
jgi:hypothetical protein